MRLIGYAIATCLIIYALQLAIVGLVVAFAVALALALIARPREVLGALVTTAFWALSERYPGHLIVGFVVIWATAWMAASLNGSATPPSANHSTIEEGPDRQTRVGE